MLYLGSRYDFELHGRRQYGFCCVAAREPAGGPEQVRTASVRARATQAAPSHRVARAARAIGSDPWLARAYGRRLGWALVSFFFFADGEGTGQKKMRERRVRDGCAAQCFACARPPTRGTRGLHRAFGARPTSCRPLSLSLSLRRDGGDVDKQGYRYRRRRHGTSFYGVCCCYSLACYTLVTTTTTTADAALQFAATCKTVLLAGKKKRARNGPVAREARRPLCCACITAQVSIGWHGAATSLVVVVVDVVACRPHWCTAHVCSTVRDPHPRPLWFRAGAAPPVPRHTRDGTGREEARAARAGTAAWPRSKCACLPGSIHQRMQAVTPAPCHTTRHRWMVRCGARRTRKQFGPLYQCVASCKLRYCCVPPFFFLHELRQFRT